MRSGWVGCLEAGRWREISGMGETGAMRITLRWIGGRCGGVKMFAGILMTMITEGMWGGMRGGIGIMIEGTGMRSREGIMRISGMIDGNWIHLTR